MEICIYTELLVLVQEVMVIGDDDDVEIRPTNAEAFEALIYKVVGLVKCVA